MSEDVALACRLEGDGAAERLAVQQGHHYTWPEPEGGEVAEPLGLALVDPVDLDRLADLEIGERGAGRLVDGAVGLVDRIPVGVGRWMSEGACHPLDQLVRDGVLQPLGLLVDGVPGVAEEPDQVLDEIDLPNRFPVLGAAVRDGLLYLAQGQADSCAQGFLAAPQKDPAMDFAHAIQAGKFVVQDACQEHDAVRPDVLLTR